MDNKKKFQVPHILVLIVCLVLIFSALSYIIPGGEYDLDAAKHVIPGTFKYIGRNPVSPWAALLSLQKGLIAAGTIISLLLTCGGALAVIVSTGCFETLLNYGIYKFQDKSVVVLVPGIICMMSILGAFAGNDSMVSFVAVGMIICSRLQLDNICAMSIFYLGFLIGMGASFTSTILFTVQDLCGVVPLSGMGVRACFWALFTIIHALYCTRYALKIKADPSRSIVGILKPKAGQEVEATQTKFPVRAFITIATLFVCYLAFAVGAKAFKWGTQYLLAFIVLDTFFTMIFYRINPNEAGKLFFKGAQSMGGICVVLGCARVIGTVLTQSKMVNTIANVASMCFSGHGIIIAAIATFIFIMLFNLCITSGTSKAAILLPLLCPIADVLGISRDLMVVIYVTGDSLTNCLTPVSGVLCAALGLANVDYTDWLKYALPLMSLLACTGAILIGILASLHWVA